MGSKGKAEYIVRTFHPDYHVFKYGVSTPGGAADQLERDVQFAMTRYNYTRLKVLAVEPGSNDNEQFITFTYQSSGKMLAERSLKGGRKEKSMQLGERNLDGSIKVNRTAERSRFVRDTTSGAWLFVDYELLDYPDHMAEAKEAEIRARAAAANAAAVAAGNAAAPSTAAC